ncbi:hypothetical protein ADIS_0711 [Lunatimonas lonarensis]|uniref:Uncharacterized protein n=1 Tax=Lunatimonas lonarensis TaxID=1232681 RepID=R7ZXU3_9BACT|nr:hypothetical protein ADIS_0711 [Lunatimonas lonarensis]
MLYGHVNVAIGKSLALNQQAHAYKMAIHYKSIQNLQKL